METTYEGMFILDSNKYSQNPDATTGEVLALLERVKAKVLASRPWQDGKLAYPMEGHRKGLYLLTYFNCDAAGLTELDRLSKLTDTIIRHMIIKPNQFEAVGRPHPLPGDEVAVPELQAALQRLRTETAAPVFVTCGEKGMYVSDPEMTLIPGVEVPGPIDPTGAGDSATAGAVLTLASGGTPVEAALVGNLVASITVQQLDTTGTASPSQVLDRLNLWRAQHAS